MRFIRGERGGGPDFELTPQPKWRQAHWDQIKGYAIRPGKRKDEWRFSATIPDEADPSSVILAHQSEGHAIKGGYTIQYKVDGLNVWKIIVVPLYTRKWNHLIEFSTHLPTDFEREVGFNNIDHSQPIQL